MGKGMGETSRFERFQKWFRGLKRGMGIKNYLILYAVLLMSGFRLFPQALAFQATKP